MGTKLTRLVAVSCVAGLVSVTPAFASCLSSDPAACSSGTYDPNTFSNNITSVRWQRFNPTSENEYERVQMCVERCTTRYFNSISICVETIPDDNPVAGMSARNACIQTAESSYLNCLSQCGLN